MGLLWLSTVPPTSALVMLMFGTRYMAMLYGFAFFSHQVGGFLGVWLGGVLYEAYGSYDLVWWLSVALGFASAAINLPIGERPVERAVPVPARVAEGLRTRRRKRIPPPAAVAVSGSPFRRSHREHSMGAFKAIVVEKGEGGQTVGLKEFDESDLMDGDVTVRVDALDRELQGRARAHRQGAGGAPLPDDPRHRFRRHRRELVASGLQAPATRSCSTAGAWARRISAPMARRRGSRATGSCRCRRA